MVVHSIKGIRQSDRKLLSQCSARVQEVAEAILHRGPAGTGVIASDSTPLSRWNPATLVESLLKEKRLHYADHKEIDFCLDSDGGELLALMEPGDFKRVISNLVDNSVDAIGEHKGLISITIAKVQTGKIEIRVSDDGRGIFQDLISRPGEKGFTHGKQNGHGLGLFFG